MKNEMEQSYPVPELELIIFQIGKFIQHWGFKEVHGRIWALLFLSRSPLSPQDLMNKLKISKALASISLRDLLHYNVIIESKKGFHGTQYYEANPKLIDVIVRVLKTRELKMISDLKLAVGNLHQLEEVKKEGLNLCEKRLGSLSEFISLGEQSLSDLLALQNIDHSF